MKVDATLRKEYSISSLNKKEVDANPCNQFSQWFSEAMNAEIPEPNAMILSTVGTNHCPSQRTVLLKEFSREGFVFYTNYASTKGKHIDENSQVCLLFPWFYLQRQVIIQGVAVKVSKEESQKYFHSRPRGSQLGAFVSKQSEKITSREWLETQLTIAKEKHANKKVPLPSNWGGYIVYPHTFEFWQGRENRLHDRIYYQWRNGAWEISRLSP